MKMKFSKLSYFNAFVTLMLLVHVLMLIDSSINHVIACVVQNVVGIVFMFFLAIFSKTKKNHFLWIFILMLSLEIQVFFGILFTGWEMGFQYYYLGSMIFSVFMSFSIETRHLSHKQKFLGISSIVLFFASWFITRHIKPLYDIPATINERISFMNYIFLFSGLAFLSNMYRSNAFKSAYAIKSLALTDDLTKLYNRRGIRNDFDMAKHKWKNESIPYAVAIIDIDDFKKINDTYGHDCGDVVLRAIGKILKGIEDKNTVTCRWGGEEFLIVRHNAIYRDKIGDITNKVAREISSLDFKFGKDLVKITITGGCACTTPDTTLQDVIKKADDNLYHGKQTGKNKIVVG